VSETCLCGFLCEGLESAELIREERQELSIADPRISDNTK